MEMKNFKSKETKEEKKEKVDYRKISEFLKKCSGHLEIILPGNIIDIRNTTFESASNIIYEFIKFQTECLKEFDRIEKDENIKGEKEKKKVKEDLVKEKLKPKLEEIKNILGKGGINDKTIKEIQKELINNYQKITEFFINENMKK